MNNTRLIHIFKCLLVGVLFLLILVACDNNKKTLEVNYSLEQKTYSRGETVSVTVTVKNTGSSFQYIGTNMDHIYAELIIDDPGIAYSIGTISNEVVNDDVTERTFKKGEVADFTITFDITDDAMLGVYDLEMYIFGHQVLFEEIITVG